MNQEKSTFWSNRSYGQKSAIGVIGVVLAVGSVIALMASLKSKPEPQPLAEPAPSKVETMVVTPRTARISVTSQGSVSPLRSIKLISEVGGRVLGVASDYADGGFFEADIALVTIDDRDYQAALAQAKADVAKAKELYALERGRARQAKREWRDLGNPDANALFLREPQVASAKSAVDAALANLDRARLNLERTHVSVPFSGRIQAKHVDIGQYVSPGTVIADVYSTEAFLIRLPLTDKQVAKVSLPFTATTKTDDLPDVLISTVYGGKQFTWRGKIVRTEASLDLKSRVTYAIAEINDPYQNPTLDSRPPLAVGMYVSAEILGVEMDNVVKIPRKVVLKENQVMVVDTDDEIRFKKVNIIQSKDEDAIVSGLEKGDRVLLTRVPYAVAGLKVDPKPETAIADAPEASGPSPSATGEGG